MNEEIQKRKIKRTICIGLGGTGRDVLMRIRRLIIDRYGKLSEFPIVSFVHLDTDKGASQVSGLRTGNTYNGEDILFRDAEKVIATMNSKEVNDLSQGLERRNLYERESPYAHIASWFPPQILKNIKAIEEGASGIRPVGRLGFFHNFRKINTAIGAAENRTRGHEEKLLEKGLIVETGLNIFVVGSLCGGTGSGMFLDVAYSLRKNYGDKDNQIVSYFVISPELYGSTPSMNANTYAALKELNYYASEGTKFAACYDPQHLVDVEESRPPFDYVYLVDNKTATDYKILEKSKLCNVIAQKIFLDFADELSPILQGQKNNFLENLCKLDEHPRPNVQRYLSFGLAKIYFPRDITVQVSLNRIKLKLVSFWLNGEGQSPDVQVLLESFLLNWRSPQGKDIFSVKLEAATQESNKTFSQTINTWKNRLENQISEVKSKEERQELIQQLPRQIRQQFRQVQPGETESSRGVWLTKLKENSSRIEEQFKQEITQFLSDLLAPGNPNFSLTSSRAFLEGLLTEINKYQRNIEDKIQNCGEMARLEDVEKQWQEAEQVITDIEGQRALFNKQRQNFRVQEEVRSVTNKVAEKIKSNFEVTIAEEALQIVKALQKEVQTLLTNASSFNNLLKKLQSFYEKREGELKQLNEDEMSGQAIFGDEDTENCYQVLLGNNERRSQLVSVSTEVTQEVGLGNSLVPFLTSDGLMDEQQLREKIDDLVEGEFGLRSLNVVQSVIKRFMEKYPFSEGSTRLEQIKRQAEVLLPLNLSAAYFYDDTAKKIQIIAFKDIEAREVKQFRDLLIKDLGIFDSILKPIQAEDEVIMVTEYAAFPLRLINGIEQLQQQYERQQKYQGSFLHNDYRTTFTEIIPPDSRKYQQLQDIFYTCLALDLLTYNAENQSYEFPYYDQLREIYYTAQLSYIWDEALEQLANLEDMTIALKNLRNEAITEIKTQPHRWEEHYKPTIQKFVNQVDKLPEDDPNYPNQAIVVGSPATIDKPAKQGIIMRIMRQIQEEVLQQGKIAPSNIPLTKKISANQFMEAEYASNNCKAGIGISLDKDDSLQYLPGSPIVTDIKPSSTQNIMKEIEKLGEMKDKGYLTEEEFQKLKKQLLWGH
ncbi:MAG: SHOCT domain-containing protein [Gomphosphaeria aponina SAG 52.96 = DSM 107014]|uniref:SHOCT domain-containing protein n=1 Tax=Gomphosphaeria aponina SAG 52.96 = DSM 107014 TaxID=1521640 RepID=A0A941GTS1_9CHRO|nr:SHOCT domain-containing protein [Gomphosphaeria aponina SAG 52.96 = DSM 107014]